MQVVAAVAEAAAVAAVDDEDDVQWRRWGGCSMAAAAFDGGHVTTCRRATRGQEGSAMRGQDGGTNKRKHSNQPAQDNERVAQ